MNHIDYCTSLLHQKLGEITFQVWAHSDLHRKTTFICGNKDIETEPPIFLDHILSGPTYKIKQVNNKVILFFLYDEGYQIAISIYQKHFPFSEADSEELFHLFHIFALEDVISDRDTELHTIIASMLSITDSLELNLVLENIMKNALKVISASDTGYVLLFNEDKQRLVTQAHVGFNDSIFKYQPTIGEGITGKVFEDCISQVKSEPLRN